MGLIVGLFVVLGAIWGILNREQLANWNADSLRAFRPGAGEQAAKNSTPRRMLIVSVGGLVLGAILFGTSLIALVGPPALIPRPDRNQLGGMINVVVAITFGCVFILIGAGLVIRNRMAMNYINRRFSQLAERYQSEGLPSPWERHTVPQKKHIIFLGAVCIVIGIIVMSIVS
ncbi:hypothetical protein KPL76_12840 [Subtercola sp. PAMC28395]|uniref:hypothetical protein n=1 Tax=Subtercola sp. PAMC28395 TaxID=2846775 RepID=UPI001C0B113D|nr:hypothetical protein [Subtercola sp. PAMC28395]QWT23577.1 hypothetical protein KPL76_12840 [Subtercola sp. PAMC28395]